MDGAGRLLESVKGWFGAIAERRAIARAERAARRRGSQGFTIPRGIGSSFAILFLCASGLSGFMLGGHHEQFRKEQGELSDLMARIIGFGIDYVGVSGNVELTREEVIALAGLTPVASLPFLDPKELQRKLLQVPLIAEASIRKLYPDRLFIDIKERVPFAIWQKDGLVQIIAADGTPIEALEDQRFLRLPHVVGPDANTRVKEYVALLASVPELAPGIRAGTLVSSRRWTLKLANGIDVKLPEEAPEKALKAFSLIEREASLAGRAILAVDLRIPDRVIVRLTEEAAAQHVDGVTLRIKKAGGRV